MKLNQSILEIAVTATVLFSLSHNITAGVLFDNSTLSIEPGSSPDASGQCTVGSCFGMQISPDFWVWTMINPGNDGGFVTGKNQLSGGQELATSETNNTPGDISAAWFFFGMYGTFFADNSLNVFSDASNDSITVLNDFNIAWNGSVIPMGNGLFNDYTITVDGAGNGNYSLDYSTVVPSGPFIGVNFRMLLKGTVDTGIVIDPIPTANDVSIFSDGTTTVWMPDVSILSGYTANCYIDTQPAHGAATVASDCSIGSYTPEPGYAGIDSFIYAACAFGCDTGTVTVEIPVIDDFCLFTVPISQVSTIGGGQSANINSTLTTIFTGHITTTQGLISGGKNKLSLCLFSTAGYSAMSSLGAVTCLINGSPAESSGTITAGDKLICTNKPDGGDTDRFSIVVGN